jgi:hypothetical protein
LLKLIKDSQKSDCSSLTFGALNGNGIAVSTHNPLEVTFAAGVYSSVFGSSRQPINSHYARELFSSIRKSQWRNRFKVIVGGSGAWQIVQTGTFEELGVDSVIEGRSKSPKTLELFWKSIRGEELTRRIEVSHPQDPGALDYEP